MCWIIRAIEDRWTNSPLVLQEDRAAVCSQMCKVNTTTTLCRWRLFNWLTRPKLWRRNQQDGPQGCEAVWLVNNYQLFGESSFVRDSGTHLPRSKESENQSPGHLPYLRKGMNWMRKKSPRNWGFRFSLLVFISLHRKSWSGWVLS